MRILVVDDDVGARRSVEDYLCAHGIEVVLAEGSQTTMELLAKEPFDLVIMDVHLESEDGLDLLRAIRADGDLPVIIVSGRRGDEVDKVVGLELGADDYLTKPVPLRELLARIRSVLRRVETRQEPVAAAKSRFRGWELDRRLRVLRDRSGEEVRLTKGEYGLLVAFLDSPGQTLSREFLLNATRVHGDIFDRSIDVQILRLRRKLAKDPAEPQIIVTERGLGYLFDAVVETLK